MPERAKLCCPQDRTCDYEACLDCTNDNMNWHDRHGVSICLWWSRFRRIFAGHDTQFELALLDGEAGCILQTWSCKTDSMRNCVDLPHWTLGTRERAANGRDSEGFRGLRRHCGLWNWCWNFVKVNTELVTVEEKIYEQRVDICAFLLGNLHYWRQIFTIWTMASSKKAGLTSHGIRDSKLGVRGVRTREAGGRRNRCLRRQ